jgi:hypothetical protein
MCFGVKLTGNSQFLAFGEIASGRMVSSRDSIGVEKGREIQAGSEVLLRS